MTTQITAPLALIWAKSFAPVPVGSVMVTVGASTYPEPPETRVGWPLMPPDTVVPTIVGAPVFDPES